MKKVIVLLLALSLTFLLALPVVADQRHQGRDDHSANDNRDSRRGMAPDRRDHRDRGDEYFDRGHDRDFEYRNPAHRPRGYRPQPRGRVFGHPYTYGDHPYHYEGHWNSWGEWERYERNHPDRYRSGRYYREQGHLYFRFCDPTGLSCFFFSIGQ